MARKAKIVRKTSETDIALDIDLDKSAGSKINTTIPFQNHMLELFVRHGRFKLVIKSNSSVNLFLIFMPSSKKNRYTNDTFFLELII